MPRKSTTKRSKTNTVATQSARHHSRRAALGRIATWGLGGAIVLGGGGALAMDFRTKLQEHDLSVIGQGTPVVVQIHDPQCSMCTALQKQTRKAMASFDDDTLMYRVADINSAAGAALQSREGLPHVTLVLYDGRGVRQQVISGVTPADALVASFRSHLRASDS